MTDPNVPGTDSTGIGGADTRVTDLDFSAADVVVVEAPDGKRSVVKGADLVESASRDAPVPGRESVKVMTVRCDRWSEVAYILSRMRL